MKNTTKLWGFFVLPILLFVSFFVKAQCPTFPIGYQSGAFSLPNPICVNQPISINTPPNLSGAKYIFDYTNASNLSNASTQTTHTYTLANTYAVVQIAKNSLGRDTWACHVARVRDTPVPDFDIRYCANAIVVVQLKANPNLLYNTYTLDWGDGSSTTTFTNVSAAHSHAYADNNTHNLVVSGKYFPSNCGESMTKAVQAQGTPLKKPIITKVEVIDATTIDLSFQNPSGLNLDLYRSRNNNTTYQKISTSAPTMNGNMYVYRITGVQADQFPYSFQLRNTQVCGTVSTPINSNEMGSIPILITQINYQNTLNWRPYPIFSDIKQYTILRDGVVITTLSSIHTFYRDNTAPCGAKVKYQIIVELNSSSTNLSLSEIKPITTLPSGYHLPKLTDYVVSVDASNHPVISINDNLTLPNAPIKSYWYYRQQGTTYDSVSFNNKNPYTDINANAAANSVCYTISYQDKCNQIANKPVTVCTIHLSESGGEKLFWTSAVPFSSPLDGYIIEKIHSSGQPGTTYTVAKDNTWVIDTQDPDQQATYRVSAISATNRISTSNIISVLKPMQLLLPTAFTPNKDTQNETLSLKGTYIHHAAIRIYNRWGTLVFNTDDFLNKEWNGITNDGTIAENGTYVYILEATDKQGNTSQRTGEFLLLR